MKLRTDYVTNSSSSSFIIGKKTDTSLTINQVYDMIRGLYVEFTQNKENLIKYIQNHPKTNVFYDIEKYSFKFNSSDYLKNREFNDFIKHKFEISLWDNISYDTNWINLETYEEYKQYWLLKMSENCHAPFTIADFNENTIDWLHFGIEDNTSEVYYHAAEAELFEWYFPEDEDLIISIYENYEIEEYKQACLNYLGHFCIYSECGYIPEYVVERLIDISEYSCNHMG